MVDEVFFGDDIGHLPLFQLEYSSFNLACSAKGEVDCTGLRIYSGAYVGIRLLLHLKPLLSCKDVIELGCGVCALGLVSSLKANYRKLVLTDGVDKTLQLCKLNIERILNISASQSVNKASCSNTTIQCWPFAWTTSNDEVVEFIKTSNNGDRFDVVIGCELMYYLTDIEKLLSTVMNLVDKSKGLFIHAHLFRRDGQHQELIDFMTQHDWITYEILHHTFINTKELIDHPEWYRVRCLISGHKDLILPLASTYNSNTNDDSNEKQCQSWLPFTPNDPYTTLECTDGPQDDLLFNIFS